MSEKLLSLSTRLNMSEDENKGLHVDLVKSMAQIVGIEEEKKSLHDKVSFLEGEYKGILEFKKGLEFKIIKVDRVLNESQELLKRHSQNTEKLDKMLAIGKSVGDKRGLGFTNEHNTFTSSKIVFGKGDPNPIPPQVSTSPKTTNNGKGKQEKKLIKKKTQTKLFVYFTCGEHGRYSAHCIHNK
ncbi:unnamed protein product [Ilex paraguariensis]|uniref:Uncharacterized protein n=1 Tax=Ilex paraguariensis TaxID=185542 RepID=A0ABC8RK72_9AQUA